MAFLRSHKLEEYTVDLKQNWIKKENGVVRDQFGCEISGDEGAKTLTHKGIVIATVNSVTAAKEISRIYLNDFINHYN